MSGLTESGTSGISGKVSCRPLLSWGGGGGGGGGGGSGDRVECGCESPRFVGRCVDVVGRSSFFALFDFRDGGANTLKADVVDTTTSKRIAIIHESLVMVRYGNNILLLDRVSLFRGF